MTGLGRGRHGSPLSHLAPHVCGEPGAKSLADDLILGQGFVRSRAAPSLRSIESQPLIQAFVGLGLRAFPLSLIGGDLGWKDSGSALEEGGGQRPAWSEVRAGCALWKCPGTERGGALGGEC